MADSEANRESFEDLSRLIGLTVLVESKGIDSQIDSSLRSGTLQGVSLSENSFFLTINGREYSYGRKEARTSVFVRRDNGPAYDWDKRFYFSPAFSGFKE